MPVRILRILFAAVITLAAVGALWKFWIAPTYSSAIQETLGHGDYVLETTDGGTFSESSLKGHVSAVFFGFTHCPEICPTTLGDIDAWMKELGPEAQDLRIWFVTVDPERDGIDMLRDYISWTPGVIGASGSDAEVAKAIAAFKIHARKVPVSDGGYTMDHSTSVLLFDREGKFAETIPYQEKTETAVTRIRHLISHE